MICDNQLFVKITAAGKRLAPDLETAPPYDGAKPYFLIDDIDNREFLVELVKETCKELPFKKESSKVKQYVDKRNRDNYNV